MDVRFVNPFLKSVSNTFATMCGAEVTFGKPVMRTVDSESADVSAIIGFSGDAAGSVVLCFSFDCACKLTTAFAGTEITPEHPDFADALGELANMVAGGAK
ncbi:MAG: chemotaxis protein CheX, partial [Planctomycetes bacterium]|nr:chemotaxis protein CheX [Planctomycetota bacterium]